MRYIIFTFLLFFSTMSMIGRPISYPSGWTIMQMNNWELSRIHIHYSPNKNNSIGITSENYNESERYNINLQWNYLLGRKNTRNSQANLYLKNKTGVAFENDKKEPNISIGIAGDWETRRYFVSYEAVGHYARDLDNGSFHQSGRIGIAPYLAEYGSTHTWIMLQAEHHPEEKNKNNQVIFTLIMRILKGDYLGELGINTNGDAMFNWIVRF